MFFHIAAVVDDFDPIAVGVFYEVDAHRWVFEADAAHFLMKGMGGFVVGGSHGEMVFLFAEVVGFGAVLHVGELEAEAGFAVPKENDRELRLVVDSKGLEAEGFLVKFKTCVEILNVEVEMVECEHKNPPYDFIPVIPVGSRIIIGEAIKTVVNILLQCNTTDHWHQNYSQNTCSTDAERAHRAFYFPELQGLRSTDSMCAGVKR